MNINEPVAPANFPCNAGWAWRSALSHVHILSVAGNNELSQLEQKNLRICGSVLSNGPFIPLVTRKAA